MASTPSQVVAARKVCPMKVLEVAKWFTLLSVVMAVSPKTALPAAPAANVRTVGPAKPDTSRASQQETIDWLCKTLTYQKANVLPWDAHTPVIMEQDASYSKSENQLTIRCTIAPTEYAKSRTTTFICDMKVDIPLSKLNDLVAIDKADAASIVVFCRTAVIDPKNPGQSTDPSLAGQFHEVSDLFGSHLDTFVDRVSIPFGKVNRAERAAAAFRHLAALTGGAPPVKPADQLF